MKHVFIAHPLGAPDKVGIEENLARAIRWYKWCCDSYPDLSFDGSWMLNCQVFDDTNGEHRDKGIERSLNILSRCDELWLVGGQVTEGMADEAAVMGALGRRVYDLTMLGDEPPQGPLTEGSNDQL